VTTRNKNLHSHRLKNWEKSVTPIDTKKMKSRLEVILRRVVVMIRAMLHRSKFCQLLALCFIAGCEDAPLPPAMAETEELRRGQQWVWSQKIRRSQLEEALWYRDNTYASERLAKYAVPGEWDDLPVSSPSVVPIQGSVGSVEFSEVEWTHDAIFELGRRAFHFFPMRADRRLSVVASSEANASEAGFWIDDEHGIGGLVRHDGSEDAAWTCATCHSSMLDGKFAPGRSNDHIDIGVMYRLAGRPNSVAEGWGAGRVDPTADGVDNPSNIPDLRGVRHQSHLHWTGGVKNSLEALAIRVDTLYIVSSLETTRPPRQVAFAVAYYLWHLGSKVEPPSPNLEAGKAVFDAECASCHSDGARGLVLQSEVGTDDTLTTSPSRGTSHYRVTSLYGVGTRGRLLHTAEFSSLTEMFDPERDRSAGHVYGLDLTEEDRAQLIDFLMSL